MAVKLFINNPRCNFDWAPKENVHVRHLGVHGACTHVIRDGCQFPAMADETSAFNRAVQSRWWY